MVLNLGVHWETIGVFKVLPGKTARRRIIVDGVKNIVEVVWFV